MVGQNPIWIGAMAGKLNARRVETLTESGRHSDGRNLYLFITPNGGKRWTFLYRWQGKKKEMGLGSAAHVSLAAARIKRDEARKDLDSGVDPIAARDTKAKAAMVIPTFGKFVDEYVKDHRPKFKSEKHAAQWEMTMGDAYCKSLRSKPVNTIDTEAVLKVLQPIWQTVPETASRIRGRLENVMDAAKARGIFQGDNPARWKGHLKSILPVRQRLTRGHHAALAYDDLPAFMAEIRSKQSLAAMALELTILCATRSGETLGATWAEFDLAKGVWTIPASRMKAGHEHRIPLSARALAILNKLNATKLAHNPHVFAGNARGKPLSNMAMAMLLRRMKRDEITVHGFRSSFRDWASEQTSFPHETCEHALAHRISDRAEAAYRRGDQFEKRRALMEAWASYLEPQCAGNVVVLRGAGNG
jgi:integrase